MKISVVVPVYNVEKYLARCISSIREQTYRDIEIILVDDGSTDKSGKLCEYYAEKDSRIVVIHKANGGLSDARNAGLNVATGDFVCFIDSDDWVEPQTLQFAVEAIEDIDIVVWGYQKDVVDNNENLLHFSEHRLDVFLTKNEGYHILLRPGIMEQIGYAWNKLYRIRDLKKHGYLFEKGLSLIEDSVFNFSLFQMCERIRFIDYIGTHYMQRNRVTLGTDYYPNRMNLKLRVAKLMRELLLCYGAPYDIAQLEYEQFATIAFRSSVRSIAQLNETYYRKRKKMKKLLEDESVMGIITKCKTKRLINQVIILAAKHKFVDVLVILEGRKR